MDNMALRTRVSVIVFVFFLWSSSLYSNPVWGFSATASLRQVIVMTSSHPHSETQSLDASIADASAVASSSSQPLETATLGGGCFWCTEIVFEQLRGVHSVVSGYAGGKSTNPTYQQVCSGTTGHAEAVQIRYDPRQISYRDLLEIFFATHDPTSLNRQGNDVGTQYRSVIFYHNPEQQRLALEIKKEVEGLGAYGAGKVVTEIVPYTAFYAAEAYHQNYYETNPSQGYCQAVISPKLAKFRKKYKDKLKVPAQ